MRHLQEQGISEKTKQPLQRTQSRAQANCEQAHSDQ